MNLGSGSSEVDYPVNAPSDVSVPNEAEVWLTSSDMGFVAGDTVSLWDLRIQPGNGVVFVWSYSR